MNIYLLVPLALLALLGCHGPTPLETTAVSAQPPPAAAEVVPVAPSAKPDASPAPIGKPSAPVEIELLRHADTVPGVPSDLVLSLTPSSALDRLSVDISGAEGLSLAPLRLDLGAQAAGATMRQAVQVTRAGARAGAVRVQVETWQGEQRRTRVVLLAVNGGEAVTPKVSAPVQTTPEGERILSLPVEETN